MNPSDLVICALFLQALTLGHGAVQLFYEPARPRTWYWIPLALVVGYFVFASIVHPAGLKPIPAPVPLDAWVGTWRYVLQVLGFSVLVEALLYVIRHQRRSGGSFGGRK